MMGIDMLNKELEKRDHHHGAANQGNRKANGNRGGFTSGTSVHHGYINKKKRGRNEFTKGAIKETGR